MSRKTIARINLGAIRGNLRKIRDLAPRSQIACVVKADAYGHGLANVVPAMDAAEILAVATIDEAQQCRDLGWTKRLVVLEGVGNRSDSRQAQVLNCELVIHHESQLALLEHSSNPVKNPIWLKLDSGMHRLGFSLACARDVFSELTRITNTQPEVLMSHFSSADDPDDPGTSKQIETFDAATEGLPGRISLANSGGILNFPQSHRDIVRPGLILYGVSPNQGTTAAEFELTPVMTLQCELIAVNSVRKGDSVGYRGNQVCPHDMTIGVAAIGYGDGYPQRMKPGAPVLVNGKRASIFGTVSMDMITIDLAGHPDAKVGDTVTLWGEGLPVEEVAPWADSIPWELICGVRARVHSRVEN